MNDIIVHASGETGLTAQALRDAVAQTLEGRTLKKVLLIPPDFTRMHSGAGQITALYYEMLKDHCKVDILPALGTHEPISAQECAAFFGEGVPLSAVITHHWRTDVTLLGQVPASYVSEVSEGLVTDAIDVEVNRRLLDTSYDWIVSIGQVVPHEVVGMANYSKNIFVGCGGSRMINASHMLGAFYGMERIMGRADTPVRRVFDYAEQHFIAHLPLTYVLTVTTQQEGNVCIHGLFAGRNRDLFVQAAQLSQQKNLTFLDKPLTKAVVYLDPREFKSTWLGNKAVYRTRMAMADGGELIILAPGVKRFGEDDAVDALIRKYGYCGRTKILDLVANNDDLRQNMSAAAHLIHGSSDGRFGITYATEQLTKSEIEGACFKHLPLSEALQRYDPHTLTDGFHTLPDGDAFFYISNPALGLWAHREKFV